MSACRVVATLVGLVLTGIAVADPADEPSVGITCDRHANLIRLNYLWRDYAGFELPDAKEWISTSTLVTVEGADTERPRWKAKAPITRKCQIGGKSYVVMVEPHIYSHNLQGRCGAGISAAVSVKQAESLIVKRTPFHTDCFSTDIIAELTFRPLEDRVILRMADGGEYDMRPNTTVKTDARKSGARGSP
jgi:hypothetical protein